MTEIEAAYLAGLLDGEGCFSIPDCVAGGPRPQVYIAMTHKSTIEWVAQRLRTKVRQLNRTESWGPNDRDKYAVTLTGKRVTRLCERLLPYLQTKREHAETLLAFSQTYGQQLTPDGRIPTHVAMQREAYRERIRLLNRRGLSDGPVIPRHLEDRPRVNGERILFRQTVAYRSRAVGNVYWATTREQLIDRSGQASSPTAWAKTPGRSGSS